MWWVGSAAIAASVYVNGVRADGLREQTYQNATVTIDANGDVRITAPGYQVQAGPSTPVRSVVPALPSGADHWWLVTEDSGSTGHIVQVTVNGTLVQVIRSGEPQRILDLSRWLHPGANQIHIQSDSTASAGGALFVYVGAGPEQSGTVELARPAISYTLVAGRSGSDAREYSIDVATK